MTFARYARSPKGFKRGEDRADNLVEGLTDGKIRTEDFAFRAKHQAGNADSVTLGFVCRLAEILAAVLATPSADPRYLPPKRSRREKVTP